VLLPFFCFIFGLGCTGNGQIGLGYADFCHIHPMRAGRNEPFHPKPFTIFISGNRLNLQLGTPKPWGRGNQLISKLFIADDCVILCLRNLKEAWAWSEFTLINDLPA
jgi:hypothetical protein